MIVVNPTGGGLSNGKLAQATATPADVLSGKTFFAGGREMQTGRLVPRGKSKSGSFQSMDDGATLTIECGFRPLMVVVTTGITPFTGDLLGYYFDGSSEGVFIYNSSRTAAGVGNFISVTNSGFIVENVETSSGDYIFFYNQNYFYYAVG